MKFIDSGCTLLNLAASQKIDGGWARGRIINFVGDGSSGKTLLSLEACAHAFYKIKDVKNKYIVYNNVEGVMDFDLKKMYGKRFVDAIIWERTSTCEEFGHNYMSWLQKLKKGDFLLYIADSLDAMVSRKAKERVLKELRTNTEEKGGYGVEKAKYFSSSFFNNVCGMMQGKDATLICISQIREKIGVMFGEKYYRTGGKALDFYTHQVVWLAEIEKIPKTFKGHKRISSVRIKARFKRNKVAMAFRECEFRILWDYGMDNINACIDFLYGKKKKTIVWDNGKEKVQMSRSDFISYIDTRPKALNRLIEKTSAFWHKIEDAVKPQRRKRFEE